MVLAAAFEETALERLFSSFSLNEFEVSGDLSEIWLETQNGKVSGKRPTSLVVDPPDGRVPYTPEGRRRWDTMSRYLRPQPLTADGPEERPQLDRCVSTNGLFIPNPFGGNYHQLLQTPDHVVILTELLHEVRIIPIDGRPHPGPSIQHWTGDSRGWWDGETLVVETTNFNNKRLFLGATERLRLLERFTRTDANTITYQLTATDPMTFARPWTLEQSLRKTDDLLFEDACHEGNYSMVGILSGARAEEAAAEAAR